MTAPPPTTTDLREVLTAARLPAAAELAWALQHLNGDAGRPAEATALWKLKTNVYRVELTADAAIQSVVLKNCNPALARRNSLVANRWLPAIGLPEAGARLLGTAGDRRGERIWLIFEDLGEATLHATESDADRVEAVVRLIAALHARSARHAVLPECRHHGADLGAAYFTANVRDAIQGLEMLHPRRVAMSPDQADVRDRVLTRLRVLADEIPTRLRQLADSGGPDVLLHGDLWTTNAFVTDGPRGPRARLVDWDHAGVGPIAYDLSTFLLRFPVDRRPTILERYRAALAAAGGWTLPATRELNAVFETAEYARYANRAVWPAVALLVDGAAWAFEELGMVAEWFEALQPVVPA
jgi:thiamine kinase-like enzyme